ncbi:MAG: hypothetical protein CUN55_06845 [Phototrophicales bacterium]|nr:MAG: hypothetical protein CUN55_06845 [Phototrophicales bacterium]
MNITSHEQDDVMIVTLDGRVDSEGAIDLDLALQTALLEGHYKLILDMANVRYLNSAGLRTLADVLTQSRDHDGDLKLVSLNPKVERVFQIIGFDKFFNIYSDLDSAISAFS